jgi:hypothetical protein
MGAALFGRVPRLFHISRPWLRLAGVSFAYGWASRSHGPAQAADQAQPGRRRDLPTMNGFKVKVSLCHPKFRIIPNFEPSAPVKLLNWVGPCHCRVNAGEAMQTPPQLECGSLSIEF